MTKQMLVSELISQGVLSHPKLAKAFDAVDRADFVLPEYRNAAYENHPLPIGHGQTISQPYTVAFMLGLLDVKKGERILDVGCGSGWTTALLAWLAGKGGKVIGIERIGELAQYASRNLAKYPLLYRTSTIVQEDGAKGYEKFAPYDKILASAAAGQIPQAWKDQLKINGRIVAPVNDGIWALDKIAGDEFKTIKHWGFAFVPLIND